LVINIIYIYDAAGELYSGEESRLDTSGFLKLAQGILFIIDPFSIQQIRLKTRKKIVDGAAPSIEETDKVLERLINYSEKQGLNQSWRKLPIFIVINKIDAIDPTIAPSDVRQWMIVNGLGNFDTLLQNNFDNVSYYKVSSLGCNADGSASFKPSGVLDPLKDIIDKGTNISNDQSNLKSRLRSQRVALSLGYSISALALILFILLASLATFRLVEYIYMVF
jgi:hypothetical protein